MPCIKVALSVFILHWIFCGKQSDLETTESPVKKTSQVRLFWQKICPCFCVLTFWNVTDSLIFSCIKGDFSSKLKHRRSAWMCLWCWLLIFLVSSNLLWLSPSLSGHVQRGTAVLHCKKRERQREGEEFWQRGAHSLQYSLCYPICDRASGG